MSERIQKISPYVESHFPPQFLQNVDQDLLPNGHPQRIERKLSDFLVLDDHVYFAS